MFNHVADEWPDHGSAHPPCPPVARPELASSNTAGRGYCSSFVAICKRIARKPVSDAPSDGENA